MMLPATSRWVNAILAAAMLCAPACSPTATAPEGGVSTTTAAPTTPSTPTTSATTSSQGGTAKPDAPLTGTWKSPSCGDRKYPREIQFAADGTFDSADLVSPCPPNVACVWSGIVHHKGTFTVAGGKITLTVSEPGGAQGKPLPATLGLDPATGAPFEQADGTPACPYTRLEKKP